VEGIGSERQIERTHLNRPILERARPDHRLRVVGEIFTGERGGLRARLDPCYAVAALSQRESRLSSAATDLYDPPLCREARQGDQFIEAFRRIVGACLVITLRRRVVNRTRSLFHDDLDSRINRDHKYRGNDPT